jgi:hypothetical protein
VRNSRISIPVAAVAVVSAILAGSAFSAPQTTVKKVPFTGSYSGKASTQVNGSTTAISATGTGTGKLIGAGRITGSGSATTPSEQQPCAPFGGTGSISGPKGKIFFTVVTGAKGCGDESGENFALVGYLTVRKATGALAKAKGQLRFTGTYSHSDGSFQIKLTGTLKKPS